MATILRAQQTGQRSVPLKPSVGSPAELHRFSTRATLLIALAILYPLLISSSHAADLAIVFDDVGYSLERSDRVIALPGPLTLAVLPFAPNAAEAARRAVNAGKEVILHQPMEPNPGHHLPELDGTLTLDMAPERFSTLLAAAFKAVPNAIGVNNHAGSLLTQHTEPMNLLMQQIDARGLFFLDSRTTHKTVALSVARKWRVPSIQRDVFLDHVKSRRAVDYEFQRAIAIARDKGYAVIIAHPYPVSLNYLEDELRDLPDDLHLIGVSELVRPRRSITLARRESPESPRISLGQ
jgi:polysaccharide deacetylase 2 family uncharacterized protein YibQ